MQRQRGGKKKHHGHVGSISSLLFLAPCGSSTHVRGNFRARWHQCSRVCQPSAQQLLLCLPFRLPCPKLAAKVCHWMLWCTWGWACFGRLVIWPVSSARASPERWPKERAYQSFFGHTLAIACSQSGAADRDGVVLRMARQHRHPVRAECARPRRRTADVAWEPIGRVRLGQFRSCSQQGHSCVPWRLRASSFPRSHAATQILLHSTLHRPPSTATLPRQRPGASTRPSCWPPPAFPREAAQRLV